MTKTYRVTFNSVEKNAFRVNIGDNIVNFPANYEGINLSKPDKKFFRKAS